MRQLRQGGWRQQQRRRRPACRVAAGCADSVHGALRAPALGYPCPVDAACRNCGYDNTARVADSSTPRRSPPSDATRRRENRNAG